MNAANPGQQQIQIDIDAKDAEGIYSNLAFLHQSPSEFILDFARIMPGAPRAKVHSRVILTPQAAKAVLGLLSDNVKRYEKQHGEIHTQKGGNAATIGFQPAEGVPPQDRG